MLVNAPLVAKLFDRNRRWASRRVRAGRYGPIAHRGGKSHWVLLENVEEAEGIRFPPERLSAIGLHHEPNEAA
jgi:hypothetical protein